LTLKEQEMNISKFIREFNLPVLIISSLILFSCGKEDGDRCEGYDCGPGNIGNLSGEIQKYVNQFPCQGSRGRFEVHYRSAGTSVYGGNSTQISGEFSNGHTGSGSNSGTFVGKSAQNDFIIAYKRATGSQPVFNIRLLICKLYDSNNNPILAPERKLGRMGFPYYNLYGQWQQGSFILYENTNCPFGSIITDFAVEIPAINIHGYDLPKSHAPFAFTSVCY